MRQMATLKLGLFKTPRDELADTVDGDVPEWIERIYQSHGTTATSAPASVSVLALSESLGFRLRKLALLLSQMEGLGWWYRPLLRGPWATTGVDVADDAR